MDASLMKITNDWHIHTRNSCDSACIPLAYLIQRAAEKGITDFGITDHLHTPYNLPDMQASRAEYLASAPPSGCHFGIEVSCVSRWEIECIAAGKCPPDPVYGIRQGGPACAELAIGITAADIDRLGIEYVVAGTHWPMYDTPQQRNAVIADYHRQNLFLAIHPLVTIVAHPWWWMGWWQDPDGQYRGDPWLDDFIGKVPRSMHDEFASAVVENGKIVEINMDAILLNRSYPHTFARQYGEYLAYLKSSGVRFSIGSDCHDARYECDFAAAEKILPSFGIHTDDLWTLPRHEHA